MPITNSAMKIWRKNNPEKVRAQRLRHKVRNYGRLQEQRKRWAATYFAKHGHSLPETVKGLPRAIYRREYAKAWYARTKMTRAPRPRKIPATGTCKWCETEHSPWTPTQKFCARKCSKAALHQRLRVRVLDLYGGKCACCGEGTSEFLTVDHVNGDGAKHRREMGGSKGSGKKFYQWLLRQPRAEAFQLLCYNCNCAKGAYGRCPHEAAP